MWSYDNEECNLVIVSDCTCTHLHENWNGGLYNTQIYGNAMIPN